MHRPSTPRARLLCALLVIGAAGCGDKGPPRKATYPVTGRVLVDGNPVENLAVRCTDLKGIDAKDPSISSAYTAADGTFKISTYVQGDGMPPGEYVLTFFWGELNLITMDYGGPDRLNERYIDPETSTIRFVVQEGRPTDLGEIKLTSN